MVKLRDGESTDSLIKRFKRDFAKSGILNELRNKEAYKSPSQKKREKRERNARMRQKYAKKAKQF